MTSQPEIASVIPWSPAWSGGAPSPHVLSNGYRTFLVYLIQKADPHWDGSYTRMIHPAGDETYPLALVEFLQPHSHRFGIVNDEAVGGHPLCGKGLEIYSAHTIEHSSWIAELKKIHKVHPYYSESHWEKRRHYLLFFHDEIFEIVANGYIIETHHSTFGELCREALNRIQV